MLYDSALKHTEVKMSKLINLTSDNSLMEFGQPLADEISRDTVVAVIYEPQTAKFLCQYWQEYDGLTCLLSGGVENGEITEQALIREIQEESGYLNYSIVGKLGGSIATHYTNKSGANFVKLITAYFVKLKNEERSETTKEDDEKFENLLLSSDEILAMMEKYEKVSGSTLADHKEILLRGVKVIEKLESSNSNYKI